MKRYLSRFLLRMVVYFCFVFVGRTPFQHWYYWFPVGLFGWYVLDFLSKRDEH